MDLKSQSLDLSIFDGLLKKRPELNLENLKKDLENYYLPFLEKLLDLKKSKYPKEALVIGVSAIQGAGKSTQGEILDILLTSKGFNCESLSIDDHYITHKQLVELRQKDPRFIRRGVTHDILLAIVNLRDLIKMQEDPVLISGYDKGAQSGDGDRFRFINLTEDLKLTCQVVEEDLVVNKQSTQTKALKLLNVFLKNQKIFLPENMGSDIPLVEPMLSKDLIDFLSSNQDKEIVFELNGQEDALVSTMYSNIKIKLSDLPNAWKIVPKKPDFVFYDGWMLGVRSIKDESIFESGLPALDSAESIQFAKDINKKLIDYEPLWQMINFLNVLYVVNYEDSLKWRDQAEDALRAKGEGMTHQQITDFVHYFWRSVHPAIHIKALAQDSEHTDQVVIINDDHSIKEVLTPQEVKLKYPLKRD